MLSATRRSWRLGIALALGASSLAASGVAASATTAPAATAPTIVVHRAEQLDRAGSMSATGGANAISLAAARNEFVSFQVSLRPAVGSPIRVTGVTLTAPGTTGLPATAFTFYRLGEVQVTTPSNLEGDVGSWPDPLVPTVDPWLHQTRNAFPYPAADAPASTTVLNVWVDVLVPVAQRPGLYNNTVNVTWQGDAAPTTSPVTVATTVGRFRLPSTTTLKSAVLDQEPHNVCVPFYGANCKNTAAVTRAQAWGLAGLFSRIALENRVTIPNAVADFPGDGPPAVGQGRAEYLANFVPLTNGTGPTRLPGARTTSFGLYAYDQTDHCVTAACLGGWKAEATAQGFADRAFGYICDEPGSDEPGPQPDLNTWQKCVDHADAMHAADKWPGLPTLATGTIQQATSLPAPPPNDAAPKLDTLVTIIQYMHNKAGYNPQYAGDQSGAYAGFRSQPGNQSWLYLSCTSAGCGTDESTQYDTGWASFAIDQQASKAMAMGWLSFIYKASGWLYYDMRMSLGTAWDPGGQYVFGVNGDGNLFYPGTVARIGGADPIPIESVRLKLIRNGQQDYEYLSWLARHGREADARAIALSLFSSTYDTNKTEAQVEAARSQLRNLVEQLVPATAGDLSGDGRADIAVFRPSNGAWYRSGDAAAPVFGNAAFVPVPADYDGDGDLDIAHFKPSNGSWYIYGRPTTVPFGKDGDVPVPADYDGDGDADIAVFRPATGAWYIQGRSDVPVFGNANFVPVPGDYDGDGKAELALFKPANGGWYVRGRPTAVIFGNATDAPVPADYDGDGDIDIAVFRSSNGAWYIDGRATAPVYGGAGFEPVPADYDGDGDADIALFKPATGGWYVYGQPTITTFGNSNDVVLPPSAASQLPRVTFTTTTVAHNGSLNGRVGGAHVGAVVANGCGFVNQPAGTGTGTFVLSPVAQAGPSACSLTLTAQQTNGQPTHTVVHTITVTP